ncbi:MAG: phytanoyl-CoA dioxygenase family protein [Acidimicrobiales bacterium]|nr:phytanoyl-CoA dioxygenase family protein [Acidimicrobiales bacterium]
MDMTSELVTADDDVSQLLASARAAEERGDLVDAVRLYTSAVKLRRDPAVERRLVGLRHRAFGQISSDGGKASWPPVVPDLFAGTSEPPEVHVDDLTAEKLASAITHHGCLLVRGVLDNSQVDQFRQVIDRSLAAFQARIDGDTSEDLDVWCSFFQPSDDYSAYDVAGGRHFLAPQGSMYTGDSPRALFDLLDFFEAASLRSVLTEYFGERPALSLKKGTLRHVPVTGGTSWHQDGAFMAPGIRSCNVWVTLTDCGGDSTAPGLEFLPRRFDQLVETGSHGAIFEWSVGDGLADEFARDTPVIRPAFAAGDALLFDDLFLHRTALDPGMDTPRYALEHWFFAPSHYPSEQLPILF